MKGLTQRLPIVLTAFVSFILLLLLIPFPMCGALAEEELVTETFDGSGMLFQEGGLPITRRRSIVSSDFESYLVSQLKAVATEINVSAYDIQTSDIGMLYFAIINKHADLFYVTSSISYSYYPSTSVVASITPVYSMPADEIPAAKTRFNAELNRIVSYASSASTPIGKALLVNDYFCINYQYDNSLTIFDAYTLFTRKTGVCQAYMLGYRAAMNKLGIPCETATSDSMNHTWNLVQVDGSWYHVDVTWNDPVADIPLGARHQYFLCSDSGLAGHSGWVDTVDASGKKYDGYFWQSIDIPIPVSGSTMYYVTRSGSTCTVNKRSFSDTSATSLTTFTASWGWSGYYGAIGIYGDRLYFTTQNAIYSMLRFGGGDVRLVYTPEATGSIYRGYVDGDIMYYGMSTSPYASTKRYSCNLANSDNAIFMLPADIVSIDANAFQGTSIDSVMAKSELKTIGSKAFANCADLRVVTLPASVDSIAADAFEGCTDLTFICPANSYAAQYANSKGFAVIDSGI